MMYDHVKKEGMECGIAGLRLYVESKMCAHRRPTRRWE